jgi:hypothetical protein
MKRKLTLTTCVLSSSMAFQNNKQECLSFRNGPLSDLIEMYDEAIVKAEYATLSGAPLIKKIF